MWPVVSSPDVYALFAAPSANDRSPRYMEKALAAIHQALRPGDTLRLDYGVHEGRIALGISFGTISPPAVLGPLVANYPRARVQLLDDPPASSRPCRFVDVRLTPDLFPILRHSQFEDLLTHAYADPIDSLLQALLPNEAVQCRVEVTISPVPARRQRRAQAGVALLERAFFVRHRSLTRWYAEQCTAQRPSPLAPIVAFLAAHSAPPVRGAPLDTTSGYRHEREADLQAASEKLGSHLFSARLRIVGEGDDRAVVDARLHAIAAALGALTRSRLATFTVSRARAVDKRPPASSFLLSHEELATLWHPPTAGVEPERMQTADFTELEAPADLPNGSVEGAVVIGRTHYRSDRRTVGLKRDDRRRHVHVVGRTGVGKTTLLLSQLHSDILCGHGVGLIDPHGDLSETVLKLIPTHRTNDVIVFDAADRTHAVSFNPLACPDPQRIDQVTSGTVAALKKLYDSWGPRLENTLRNAVFATVEQQGTIVMLLRLLTDESYRERTVPLIRDDVVRAFWQHEFSQWTNAYRTEAVAAITNKIQPFLTNSSVRAIVGQTGKSLDLRRAMDERKIIIANLSKGKIGEDNSALLGAFLVTAIQQAAMTRADMPEDDRRDFYLYIDEFQNFVTTSFETILSEARKYRLNLTISHQYLAQLNEATAAAIAGNIGTMIAFAVGSTDAEWLATAMMTTPNQLTPQDLVNLPKYTAYARLLIDGLPSAPFSITTFPPPEIADDRSAIVLEASRRQFSRPRQQVAQQVSRDLAARPTMAP